MAVVERERATGTRRSPAVAARAAKDKRQKVILIVAAIFLLALVAFQLTRLMGGDEAAAPAPTAAPAEATGVAPAPATPGGATATPGGVTATPAPLTRPPRRSPLLNRFQPKDPFVPKVRTDTGTAGGAQPTTAVAPQPTPAPARTVQTGHTVVLASIRATRGRGLGRTLSRARAAGLPNVRIVNSSNYRGLRAGYFAVVSGPFQNRSAAQRALRQARVSGFPRAYLRRVAR